MANPTAADHVFEQVVADILAGALRPREHVSERDLVTRFGVSRTPVREAIKRLFERGLVEAGPKGVSVVKELAAEDLRKLYELRLDLESRAAALTAANIAAADIEQLRKLNRQFKAALGKRDLVRMLEVRADFHALLVHATGNRWLAEILVTLRDWAYVVRHLHWQDPERAGQTLLIHDQMIDALTRHDAKIYRDLVVRQIRAAIECYEQQLRPPTAPLPRGSASGESRRARVPAK